MTNAYKVALEKTNAATKEFTAAQKAFRTGTLSADAFVAAKKAHDAAQAEFDIAFAAEQEFETLVQIEAIEQTVKQNLLF